MRLKEISTLVGAGILSLAAVILLEREGQPAPSATAADPVAQVDLVPSPTELSLPVPTAEPPVAPAENGGPLESVIGDRADVTSLQAAPLPPQARPPIVTPQPNEPTSPAAPATTAKPAAESLKPEADTQPAATPGSSLSEGFKKSVSDAAEAVPDLTVTTTVGDEQPSIIEETPEGFWLKSAKLNDVFQHLAQLGDYQYFHNTEIDGPTFVVTGQLMTDDPIRQMEELSLMYGLTIHQKGNTVYALTAAQLSQLPTEPFRYQLKYLRPKDIEQIKLILQPFLTPGSGIIEFETKTNTLIVMDNARKLDALAIFLDQMDQPKQQIAIETRILRVSSNTANRIGVDWSSVLGERGTSLSSVMSLNSLFNLPDLPTSAAFSVSDNDGNNFTAHSSVAQGEFRTQGDEGGSGSLVLSPVQLTAVLRALNEGDLAEQESSPTLIAEDNEEGLISIIDRIPIITSTVTITNGIQNVTDEVRYKIDEEDPAGDPNTTREVGVSVSVTPTILPDNTIRMALRPRTAQVTEYITSPSGNIYPRVNESSVTTTARVPNGHSLLIGGFYEESLVNASNKIPILGDIPAVNLLFKSSGKEKQNTSLVFIITPKLYRPDATVENDVLTHELHDSHVLPANHDYPDRENPGSNFRSNLRNSLNNAFKRNAPDEPTSLLDPQHPYNRPEALPIHGKSHSKSYDEPVFVGVGERPEVVVRPAPKKNSGFLGKMFGGHKKPRTP